MVAIVSLLVVIVISMLVVRVATVALTLTGISEPLARFQARSAFTGAGFTTSESEKVVQHPVRRRIIMLLMLLGNAGLVTAASSLMLSFVGADQDAWAGRSGIVRVALLVGGAAALWWVATSEWLDNHMSRWIGYALKRWTSLEVRDYAGLLHLTGDYVVAELNVSGEDWLAGRPLQDLRLRDEGVVVLGIEHPDGTYTGTPRGPVEIGDGDTLLLYGRADVIGNLDVRRSGPAGNWDHHKAVDKQRRVEQEEIDETGTP